MIAGTQPMGMLAGQMMAGQMVAGQMVMDPPGSTMGASVGGGLMGMWQQHGILSGVQLPMGASTLQQSRPSAAAPQPSVQMAETGVAGGMASGVVVGMSGMVGGLAAGLKTVHDLAPFMTLQPQSLPNLHNVGMPIPSPMSPAVSLPGMPSVLPLGMGRPNPDGLIGPPVGQQLVPATRATLDSMLISLQSRLPVATFQKVHALVDNVQHHRVILSRSQFLQMFESIVSKKV